jgi:gamma-glutamyl-gamma-aminobutyrate hydrolase PuuD
MSRLRILVSQRLDVVAGRDEFRDALDTRLSKLLWELGFLPLSLTSQIDKPVDYLTELAPNGILLSGGNDIGSVPDRDAIESAVLDYAVIFKLPVFGICRGMQFINKYQMGSLRPVTNHLTKHQVHGPLITDINREVNSFHDFGILEKDLGHDLEAIAWSEDGVVEALKHQKLPWLGIMWHPERNTPVDEADRNLITRHFSNIK